MNVLWGDALRGCKFLFLPDLHLLILASSIFLSWTYFQYVVTEWWCYYRHALSIYFFGFYCKEVLSFPYTSHFFTYVCGSMSLYFVRWVIIHDCHLFWWSLILFQIRSAGTPLNWPLCPLDTISSFSLQHDVPDSPCVSLTQPGINLFSTEPWFFLVESGTWKLISGH